MRLVSTVDFPVPVKAAGVCQLLATHLAGHAGFAVTPDFTSSTGEKMGYCRYKVIKSLER